MTQGMVNAFAYEDSHRMEEINSQLTSNFLALPAGSDAASSHNDDLNSHFDLNSQIGQDMISERSAQLSEFSRRTGISNISHTVLSQMSKASVMPKEKHLVAQAEARDLKERLQKLDSSLSQARDYNTKITAEQVKLLVEECEREVEMQEVPSELESDSHSVAGTVTYEHALVPLPVKSTALDHAKQILWDIENNPNIMNGTETIGEMDYGLNEEEIKEQKE